MNHCNHDWKYDKHGMVRTCSQCQLREIQQWIAVPQGAEICYE